MISGSETPLLDEQRGFNTLMSLLNDRCPFLNP